MAAIDTKRLRELATSPFASYPPGSVESWGFYEAVRPNAVIALLDNLEAAQAKAAVIGGEACLEERARGNGPCGACAVCCRDARQQLDVARGALTAARQLAEQERQRHNEELARVQVQRDEARQEVERLTKRQQELLATIVRVTNETPYPDEIKGWQSQRSAMIAEVGSLKAEVIGLKRALLEVERDRDRCMAAMVENGMERDALKAKQAEKIEQAVREGFEIAVDGAEICSNESCPHVLNQYGNHLNWTDARADLEEFLKAKQAAGGGWG